MSLIKNLVVGGILLFTPKIADAQSFEGESSGYEVQIDRDKINDKYRTTIFMYHGTKGDFPYEITAHDYNNTDALKWDMIKIKRKSNDCFNAISFAKNNTWSQTSLPGCNEKESTPEEIKQAKELINRAVSDVAIPKNKQPDRVPVNW